MSEFEEFLLEDREYVLNLPYHLAKVGIAIHRNVDHELYIILTDFDFINHKIILLSPQSLIEDYDLIKKFSIHISEEIEENLKLIQGAVRLSANILSKDKTQISGQLIGRLLTYKHSEIKNLLKQAKEGKNHPWIYPLIPSLEQPDGLLLRTINEHTGCLTCIVVTTDGKKFITGAINNEIKIWDLETGVKVNSIKGHTDTLGMTKGTLGMAITTDGKTIIYSSYDTTIKICDLGSQSEDSILQAHNGDIHSVVVTDNGKYIVTASDDETIKIWDLENKKNIQTIKYKRNITTPISIKLTVDQTRIIASSNNNIKVWNLYSGEEVSTLIGHSKSVAILAITPDGKKIISGSYDKTIKIWDLDAQKEINTLIGHKRAVISLAVTPDGERVISGSSDGIIKIWNLEIGTELNTFVGHSSMVTCLAITPNGSHLISGSLDMNIKIWKLTNETFSFPHILGHYQSIKCLAIIWETKQIVSGSLDNTINVSCLESGERLFSLSGHNSSVNSVALIPFNKTIASGSYDGVIKIWDIENQNNIATLKSHTGSINCLSVTSNLKYIISASDDKTIKIWNLETMDNILTLEGHQSAVNSIVCTSDSKKLISASDDKTIKLWDLETGKEILTFIGNNVGLDYEYFISSSEFQTSQSIKSSMEYLSSHFNSQDNPKSHCLPITAVAFLTDLRIVSSSWDNTIKVWSILTRKELFTLKGHTSTVKDIAVSTDCNLVISVSSDRTLKVWDLKMQKVIASFTVDNRLNCCAIAPDNMTIVAGDASGRLHFLRLEGMY